MIQSKSVSIFGKYIALLLFLILPKKLCAIFTNLSILALIYELRNIEFSEEFMDKEKLENLFNIYINEKILIFPKVTITIFWSDKILQKEIMINGHKLTIKEAIEKDEYFYRYKSTIVNNLIKNLPRIIRFKLDLDDRYTRNLFKNNLLQALY
jgi:uncharacterized protein YlzI (FlbEa/FlbD family)